jgi:hypothetical protein
MIVRESLTLSLSLSPFLTPCAKHRAYLWTIFGWRYQKRILPKDRLLPSHLWTGQRTPSRVRTRTGRMNIMATDSETIRQQWEQRWAESKGLKLKGTVMNKALLDVAERRRRQQERLEQKKKIFAAMISYQKSRNPHLKRGHLYPK